MDVRQSRRNKAKHSCEHIIHTHSSNTAQYSVVAMHINTYTHIPLYICIATHQIHVYVHTHHIHTYCIHIQTHKPYTHIHTYTHTLCIACVVHVHVYCSTH